jgi:Tol biopolymer transport system component
VIVFGGFGNGNLQRVSAAGGIPAGLTATGGSLPSFLPDGKHFVYRGTDPQGVGMYAGSLDAKPTEQSKERFLDNSTGASYVDGNIFFVRDGTLMVQGFDDAKLQLRGEPAPVAENVGTVLANALFSVSPAGVLAFRTGAAIAGLQSTWFDREGKATGTFGQPGPDRGLVLSPDGTHAAGRDAAQTLPGDIWLLDFARGVRTRLTFHQGDGSYPVWSPDGSRIFFSTGNPMDTIFEKAVNGAGEDRELLKIPGEAKIPSSASRDGHFLLYHAANVPKTGSDLWVLPLDGQGANRKPVLLLGTDFNERYASFSPDGRWIAYMSNESGREEIYVRPFVSSGSSGPALGEGKWQVSKDGGALPKWRDSGKEIVFMGLNDAMMAVDVNGSGAAFQMGTPQRLFTARTNQGWDVTADGKRFLMTAPPGQGAATQTPITVVLNWQADLKR